MNLAELRRLWNAGKHPKFTYFWGHTPRDPHNPGVCVFSQWYPSVFEVDGERFATAEHWMMAGKARLFNDEQTREKILEARSPGAAKALGRKVQNFNEAAWVEARFGLVVEGNRHKFAEPDLRDILQRTRKKVLVEAAPNDRIWGIGLAAEDPRAQNPLSWKGLNLLGFALMKVRG